MKIIRALLVAFAGAALAVPAGIAQSALPEARPSADEVRAIRQMVEKQGQQLDELRQALAELTKIVQLKESAAATPPAAAPAPAPAGQGAPLAPLTFPPPPAPSPAPSGGVVEPAPAPAPAPPGETRVERAEAAFTPHTVVKGETLTSIAKQHNISIADLQKANKVVDDRKLQIGQILRIPTPKAAETPIEKKETP